MKKNRLWTLTKDTRTATCDVDAHPLGLELRYTVAGELHKSEVCKTTTELQCRVQHARAAFEALGWSVEP
jgi:hypothetical protein